MNVYDQKTAGTFTGGVSLNPPRPPASPIEDAHSTFNLTREFSVRVQALVDRAVGPIPEAEAVRGNSVGPGVLVELQDSALSTRDVVNDGMRALARLEQALS